MLARQLNLAKKLTENNEWENTRTTRIQISDFALLLLYIHTHTRKYLMTMTGIASNCKGVRKPFSMTKYAGGKRAASGQGAQS